MKFFPCSFRFLLIPLALLAFRFETNHTNQSIQSAEGTSLSGVVVTQDGKPIPDVLVYGSESKKCCPFKREQTKTDESGHFVLNEPGAVVHFSAENFEERAWVVPAEPSDARITLEPVRNSLVLPICKGAPSRVKRISWGQGPEFRVPKKDFTILGGKPDTDYVRYVIKSKDGAYLELWFGPYAFSSEPSDEFYVNSVSFTQRSVSVEGGQGWGNDVSGELRTGERWRHTYIGPGNGARYKASAVGAAAFDRIIDSACFILLKRS